MKDEDDDDGGDEGDNDSKGNESTKYILLVIFVAEKVRERNLVNTFCLDCNF